MMQYYNRPIKYFTSANIMLGRMCIYIELFNFGD